MLRALIQYNGGCRLPCWWGLTPGQTRWETAQELLTALDMGIHAYGEETDSLRSYDVTALGSGLRFAQNYVLQDGVITRILVTASPAHGYGDAQFAQDWHPYRLSQILAVYGAPQQVFLLTYRSGPDSPLPYYLLVFYPAQGFLVYYTGNRIQAGDALSICPMQSEIILLLWPPGEYASLAEAIPQPNPFFHPAEDYAPIQEVTEMSVEVFYDRFKDADEQTCFETPGDLW